MRNQSRCSGNEHAFTLIELVTATAVLGFMIAGIATLVSAVISQNESVETFRNIRTHDELLNYIECSMDDMAVLTKWDSTYVEYLSNLGQREHIEFSQITPTGIEVRVRYLEPLGSLRSYRANVQ